MKPKSLNVLWLMSDQHNANSIGYAGHPDVKTPNLDRLARQGVWFENAFCNNPICAPSRACFSTGLFMRTHGISSNDIYEYSLSNPNTLAKHFRDHGYQTAIIGKGHLPKVWMEAGFEHRRYSDLADGERDDPFSVPYFKHLVESGLGDDYDLGTLPPDHVGGGMRAFTSAIPFEHSMEKWTGDEALEFLKNRDQKRPFFLKVSFQRPHDPFCLPPEKVNLYDPSKIHLPENSNDFFEREFQSKPEYQKKIVSGPKGSGYPYRALDKEDLKRQIAYHFGIITMIDEQIGRVIEELEKGGELDRTIIVYVADHGDFAGEHGLALKNLGIYESIHRIPFILCYPKGPKGVRENGIVESVDFFPTLCDLASLPIPKELDGHSLQSMLNEAKPVRSHTICEYDFRSNQKTSTIFAVRTEQFRLVYNINSPDEGELYDRKKDPGEIENLYSNPQYQSVRLDLIQKLVVFLGHYPRYSFDVALKDAPKSSVTKMLHKQCKKWSEVKHLVKNASK
jgi:arylsulfatase A-like enzyme